jgi:hypothetical protein
MRTCRNAVLCRNFFGDDLMRVECTPRDDRGKTTNVNVEEKDEKETDADKSMLYFGTGSCSMIIQRAILVEAYLFDFLV